MMDRGLLASLVAVVVVVWAAERWILQRPGQASVLDVGATPLIIGIVVARLTAVLLDDPSQLGRPADLLIIRGGVEFWAGVGAAAAMLAWTARRASVNPLSYGAAIVPAALTGYATYSIACVVRDGCFGPVSPVGLVPPFGGPRLLPVEIGVGLLLGWVAWALDRWCSFPSVTIGIALSAVAIVRLLTAWMLPRLDTGFTRLEFESIGVALLAGLILFWGRRVTVRRRVIDRL